MTLDPNPAWCPRCHKDVEFVLDGGRKTCPACGAEFALETSGAAPAPFRTYLRGWFLFLGCMLLPALATWLTAVLGRGQGGRSMEAAVFVGIAGSVLAGVVGGIWAGRRLTANPGLRLLLGLLLMLPLGIACFVLCFLGCALGDRISHM